MRAVLMLLRMTSAMASAAGDQGTLLPWHLLHCNTERTAHTAPAKCALACCSVVGRSVLEHDLNIMVPALLERAEVRCDASLMLQ